MELISFRWCENLIPDTDGVTERCSEKSTRVVERYPDEPFGVCESCFGWMNENGEVREIVMGELVAMWGK